MARRQVTEKRGGSKALVLLAAALFIFWAGHDPVGAAALVRHFGQALGQALAAAHHAHTAKSTTP